MVLLGFSYGGMVVTGALRHIDDRVRHLVYLDAFVPRDGDSVVGLIGGPTDNAIRVGDQWSVPPTERHFDDPAEAEFMSPRRTSHPIRCFTEPVRLQRSLEDHPFERTYIRATADVPDAPGTTAFDAAADHARRSPAWHYREIATNHMVASNRAEELTSMLVTMA
jgi:pimeloyl-ACP methyl ester carboxylesterase